MNKPSLAMTIGLAFLAGCGGSHAEAPSAARINLSTFEMDVRAAIFRDYLTAVPFVPDSITIHLGARASVCQDQFDYLHHMPPGAREVRVMILNPRPGTCQIAPYGLPPIEDAYAGTCKAWVLLQAFVEQDREPWTVPAVGGTVEVGTLSESSLRVSLDALFPEGALGEHGCFENEGSDEPGVPPTWSCECRTEPFGTPAYCETDDWIKGCCNEGQPTERLVLDVDATYCPVFGCDDSAACPPDPLLSCAGFQAAGPPECETACGNLLSICGDYLAPCATDDSACREWFCGPTRDFCRQTCGDSLLTPLRAAVLSCLTEHATFPAYTACMNAACLR